MKNERARITPYRDGPYLIRGPFALVDQSGRRIECSRGTIALCRCGRSQIRPFCDGTHRQAGFEAPSGAEEEREAPAGRGDGPRGPLRRPAAAALLRRSIEAAEAVAAERDDPAIRAACALLAGAADELEREAA